MSGETLHDEAMRSSAAEQVRRRAIAGVLSSDDLALGFSWAGERIPLVNPQRGIFKPRKMRHLLSIRTVYPRAGARVWYDDQRRVHEQVHSGEELIDYAFMGTDPGAADNQWLRDAMLAQVPVIYFLGVAPGRYAALYPAFVADWSASALKARIALATPDTNVGEPREMPSEAERRYALRVVSARLHQATFREAVLAAYGGRCAISRLPEPRLLDAAHIIVDRHEALGQPVVPNGIPLSKVHHAAFDANLIGIDPDFKVHVSEALLSMNDGPMLEQGIKAMDGRTILLPGRLIDYPDRDRLAARFEVFGYAR
jgi:putative restriction endonuclease